MRTLATIALLCIPGFVQCADVQTPESIASQFFRTFLKGGDVEAIDDFMGLNPILKGRPELLQRLKTQLTAAIQLYGEPLAVELVSVEDITPSLQRRVYLTKHPHHPLVWEMYFYRPVDEWIPDQLIFQDQYQVIGPKQ